MPGNGHQRDRESEKARKEHADITIERARTGDIKKLKTLDELIKEKP